MKLRQTDKEYSVDFEIYHDESKANGYWHGMLLVPTVTKENLLHLLAKARNTTNYRGQISFKNIRGSGNCYECQRIWVQLALLGLRSRLGRSPGIVDWGKLNPYETRFENIDKVIGLKFILFREIDNLTKMSNLLDFGGKVETTFRMGIKGGLHYLGSESNPINITKIHFDGHEHYRRRINHERLINRLYDLRSYVTISESNDLIDDRSSKANTEDSQLPEDCEFLQLTDLIIGSFRSGLIGQANIFKNQISYPIISLLERYTKGYARMRNSRWANSLCISQCYLSSGKWHFETIDIEEKISNLQPPLPFLN